MKKTISLFKRYKLYLIIGGVVLIALIYFIFGRGGNGMETYTVTRGDVVQSVVLSGDARTSDRADLGFASSGRVARIFVDNNQNVSEGAVLAQLEIGDLLADLKVKEASLRAANVDLEAAKEELDRVKQTQDAKVQTAYSTLLSEDLILVANSASYDVTAPSVTGIYKNDIEGRYKIIIKKEDPTKTEVVLRTFDLESTERVVNENGPTMLGTKGLYINFSEDLENYLETTWYLDIPNKSSSSYLANYNAYNEAKKARDLAVQEAEFKYKKLLTEGDNGNLTIAQAEVEKIKAEIRKNTIYAPFSGKVTNIQKEVGENVSVGEQTLSIIGESKLEIVLQVSELDVSRIVPGTEVKLSFDAIPDEEFIGTLKTVNSRDTEIEGVPVYEAFVDLELDSRIKTGMTTIGSVVIASKTDVLSIPNYFVTKQVDKDMVTVLQNGKKIEREVLLGILGSDSMIEVISGLNEGYIIVSNNEK